MTENERIGLLEGLKRPVAAFNHLADERLADAVGCATYFGTFRHELESGRAVIKTCFQRRWLRRRSLFRLFQRFSRW